MRDDGMTNPTMKVLVLKRFASEMLKNEHGGIDPKKET
jgi:hypothetical protein